MIARQHTGAGRLLLLLAGTVGAAGCGEAGTGADPPTGGTAVVAYEAGPISANPFIAVDSYSQQMNIWLLYLPLLRVGPDLAPEPALAESVELEGDTAAILRLRRDVRWSDSVRTTAHDAVFTIERALDPATGYGSANELAHIREAEAVDSFTLRLRLTPIRDPLLALTVVPILPRHVLESVEPGAMRSGDFNLRPVTNGPFRLVEARPNDRWIFAANELFPEGLGGRPHLDRLIWRVIPESAAQIAELRAGDADVVVGVRAAAFDDTTAQGVRRIERPMLGYSGVAWNGRRPPLRDPRVRRALTHAIDRRAMLEGLRGGHGTLAAGPVPPGHWAYSEELEPLPHDTAAARAALAEAGYVDRDGDGIVENAAGEPLRLTLLIPAGDDQNRDMGQVMQSHLGRVGVALELRPLELNTMLGVITAPDRDFDGVLLGLNADARMDLRTLYHGGYLENPYQVAGYSRPAVDSLLDRIEATVDREAAAPMWAALQDRIAEDQPWTYLYFATELILVRERLQGVEADLRGILHSAQDWWVRPRQELGAEESPEDPD